MDVRRGKIILIATWFVRKRGRGSVCSDANLGHQDINSLRAALRGCIQIGNGLNSAGHAEF